MVFKIQFYQYNINNYKSVYSTYFAVNITTKTSLIKRYNIS